MQKKIDGEIGQKFATLGARVARQVRTLMKRPSHRSTFSTPN